MSVGNDSIQTLQFSSLVQSLRTLIKLWKTRTSHATNLCSRSHLEQRWNRELRKSFCATAAPTIIFSLSTPSSLSKSASEASEASVACGGHSSSFFHKNSAPFLHFSNFLVSEALVPREAWSAGLCSDLTWRHCLGSDSCLIMATWLATKGKESLCFVCNILQNYHWVSPLSNTVNPQSSFEFLSYYLVHQLLN